MEEILHHLGSIKPWKYLDKLLINWCRICSINSIGSTPQICGDFFAKSGLGKLSRAPWRHLYVFFAGRDEFYRRRNHKGTLHSPQKKLQWQWSYRIESVWYQFLQHLLCPSFLTLGMLISETSQESTVSFFIGSVNGPLLNPFDIWGNETVAPVIYKSSILGRIILSFGVLILRMWTWPTFFLDTDRSS